MKKMHIKRTFISTGMIILLVLLFCQSGSAASGNRIWDESKGMPSTYTWNSYSFAGFYYNLNDNLGTEELTISNIGRTISRGDLSYRTAPVEINFDYSGFGKYQVLGFMADRYFAGYSGNSVISNNKAKSTLPNHQLHKVLLDDEGKRIVSEGGTLTLNEGYVLKMKEVDISAGPGQVWVILLKDGVEVDNDALAGSDTYVYSKKVGGVDDLPLIAIHFDNVFRGREVNAVFIRGIFQISEDFTQVRSGDRYGALEITSVGGGGIEMVNDNSISLSAGNSIDLMGNLKIVVADSSVLRFALSVEKTGIFDARGTIYPSTIEWTPMNFGLNIGGTNIGFYYDMDNDVGKEKLRIDSISGTTIPDGKLSYSTSSEEVNFEYSGFGKYRVIGFMADKYFAGYSRNSEVSNKNEKSTLGSNQIHKVLLDDDTKRTVSQGSTLTLKEGYVLKIKDVDIGAGPGQVLVALLKDGNEIDTDVVSAGDTYTYVKKVGSVSDLPLIAIHFDSIFRGREINAAFSRGIFQISESFTSVRSGDRYGVMEVNKVGGSGIEMTNANSVDVSSGSTVDVMGNIKFRVANSNDVRFYPFVEVRPEMIANQLLLDAPVKATAGDTIKIKVTAAGKGLEGVNIAINSEGGITDTDGIFSLTVPKTLKGTYNITAAKLGYEKASKDIEVQAYAETRLSINAPSKANQFETITLQVTNNNQPVSGATVSFDSAEIGQTDASGTLKYKLETSGTHTFYASKTGYITAAMDIDIRLPFAEYRALDIKIEPRSITANENVKIRSNITNIGTKAGNLPVVLIINHSEVTSSQVAIGPGEIKEVAFDRNIDLTPGNYTVEIIGMKTEIEVREAKFNVLLALVLITGVGAIIIYLLTRKTTPKK